MNSSFLFVIPVVFLVNKIDFTEDLNLLLLRVLFGVVHTVLLAITYLLYTKIVASNDKTPVKPKDGPETTVVDHDIAELKKYLGQIGFSLVFVAVLHLYVGLIPPLAVQCVLNPMNLYNHNLFQIYFMGKDTPELRKRPWIVKSAFAAFGAAEEEPEAENNSETNDTDDDLNKMQKTMDDDEELPKKKESKNKKKKNQ